MSDLTELITEDILEDYHLELINDLDKIVVLQSMERYAPDVILYRYMYLIDLCSEFFNRELKYQDEYESSFDQLPLIYDAINCMVYYRNKYPSETRFSRQFFGFWYGYYDLVKDILAGMHSYGLYVD